jgi:pyruvate/2-oxoglutarate dehydrogenase complex dihydrolipoamide acyltransferase (E2) component
MFSRLVLPWVLVVVCGTAAAQAEPPRAPAAAPAASASTTTPPAADADADAAAASHEPAVRKTVIDEDGTHIEELRVRGELRSVKVQPKVGRAYEVVPSGGARDAGQGRSTAGQRVWSLLTF